MYHLKLKSDRTEFMPYVTFTYPEVEQAKWQAVQQAKAQDRADKTIPQTGEYLGDLNFDYKLSGKASWKPIRVYNDGVKTIIQMPKSMAQTESPTLLVMRGNSDKDAVIVNYRVQGDRYIVDSVFDKAILIAGVGRKQDRITITKGK
jgi:type IV secretion system protein VirB9